MLDEVVLSLSEVEALALKAARGAGYSWGLAEEAAFATRWLCEQGLDGLRVLADHLDGLLTSGQAPLPPQMHALQWRAADTTPLCPIMTGAAINDHFGLPEGPRQGGLTIGPVAFPALMLPFVAIAAAREKVAAVLGWARCKVIVADGALLALEGNAACNVAQSINLTVIARATPAPRPFAGLPTKPDTGHLLAGLAHRTYVPATDQSRRGAGAAGTDNQ